MIFWLVLKLEIGYKFIISWRVLVSCRGLFDYYIFAWWNIWVSIILSFSLKIIFNAIGKATVWQTPCWNKGPRKKTKNKPKAFQKQQNASKEQLHQVRCPLVILKKSAQVFQLSKAWIGGPQILSLPCPFNQPFFWGG
jgi:hypothetical protein